MHSIKTKLAAGMCVLIALLFALTAWMLVTEKRNELSRDIYVNARNFSELTSTRITTLYDELLKEYSFILFNREMSDIFRKNTDVSAIRLYSYSGEILYNSQTEQFKKYIGDKRQVQDPDLLKRIKAQLPNVATTNGRVVYFKKNAQSEVLPVDEFEHSVRDVGQGAKGTYDQASTELISSVIYPLNGTYAVEYIVSYDELEARVKHTTERIVLLMFFGVLIGLAAAISFALRITKPIEELTVHAKEIGTGNLKVRVNIHSKDEIGQLSETFNKMAADLEISTAAMIERQKLAHELQLAAKIQSQIIPKELPKIEGIEIATALIPAEEVGGDSYDFINPEPDRHVMYISDVTGHGVPSGLVVSIANALIYSFVDRGSIRDILIQVNKVLKKKTSQNMFMTLLMVNLIRAAGTEPKLTMVSAGHPEMLHYKGKTKTVECEKGGGIAVGMIPDISKLIQERELVLEVGDIIALYSDGIPECGSESGIMYGMDAFKASLQNASALPTVEAIRDALISDVKKFMGSSAQLDDITLIVIRRTS